tara:strand:+ start:96 stop:356 length:261 start_codon:yes stop_codon:yes gene_type:complete
MLKTDDLSMSAVIRMCIDLGVADRAGFDAIQEAEIQEMRIQALRKQIFNLQTMAEDITTLLFVQKKDKHQAIEKVLTNAGFIEVEE